MVPVLMGQGFGRLDFGHAWSMKKEISTASRAGARDGTRYQSGYCRLPRLNPRCW